MNSPLADRLFPATFHRRGLLAARYSLRVPHAVRPSRRGSLALLAKRPSLRVSFALLAARPSAALRDLRPSAKNVTRISPFRLISDLYTGGKTPSP